MMPVWQRARIERQRAASLQKRRASPKRHKKWDAPPGTKWCNRCERYREVADFRASKRRKDALEAYCEPCRSDYLFEFNLKKKFSMTVEQYDALFDLQEGRCAVCMCRPRSRRLAVDHNHKTGVVRGLLCTRCNHKVLGAASERPEVLRRAANYLEAPPAVTGQAMDSLGHYELAYIAGLVEEAKAGIAPGQPWMVVLMDEEQPIDDALVVLPYDYALGLAQKANKELYIVEKMLS